jgi:F420H(2)-dependent quinone reductase
MAEYVPNPRDWVREQVELYESSGGTKGTTLRDTGLPVVIVTHVGNKTGAIRKTPLMRVKDGNNYVLIGSQGGAPTDPVASKDAVHIPQSAGRLRRKPLS